MTEASLIVARPQGLYCPPGDFYIDPWRNVDRAVITHAHGDHARPGHASYLAATPAEQVLRTRLVRSRCRRSTTEMRSTSTACASRCILPGMCWLLAGEGRKGRQRLGGVGFYKLNPDVTSLRSSRALRHIHHRVDVWIADLPLGRLEQVFSDINAWWSANAEAPRARCCCAMRSARRSASCPRRCEIGRIVVHGAVEPLNRRTAQRRRAAADAACVEPRRPIYHAR